MFKFIIFLSLISSLGAIFSVAWANSPLSEMQLQKIINSQSRYPDDHSRDGDRRPIKILKFSEVTTGDTVLDLFAGGGWYTELFSLAVGASGHVFAHNDELTWRFGQQELSQRTLDGRLANVTRLDAVDLAEIAVPDQSVDIAFMGINYHDLFFTSRVRNGEMQVMRDEVVDHKKALSHLHNKLKDDGVLIIIDHIAEAGSGYDAANDLHRIDPNIVKHQLRQNGFELLEEAFYLRNPKDDLSRLVFDPKVRGKTSRFTYKFAKK